MTSANYRKPALAAALAGALLVSALPGTAQADNFTLRIGSGHPSGPSVYANLMETFFVPEVTRRVEEETDHTINFIEGYGGAIAGVSDTLEAVQDGLLDIGGYCFCFEPSKLFVHNFPYYAPFGPQSSSDAMTVVRQVYDEYPWLSEVFESDYNQTLLGLSGWDNYHLGTTDPWETVADLEGVRIGGAGPNLPWLEYAGAVPVQSSLPDGYMNLQTGIYNGWLMFPSAYLGYRWYEPAPNYTLIGFGPMVVVGMTMNLNSLARLPEDVQAIIREVGAQYEDRSGGALDEAQANGLAGLEEAGANIRELSDEARAQWAESLGNYPDIQSKEADGRGLPGTEVMQIYLDKVAESGHEWPFAYELN
ncbi:C4-dicarboxylate TRAP transporter substrate-binding protein [Pelagibacterium montanilacus]|uniref:C4-dicarboxylate TRAP transporter substrate-binding protein n=1 Tax=Pelagibacterium montanilacus TaxID=2185280 RepID=UPI000F8DA2B0|nr:C4-dicarboxylate TRAP transporter substrate-binding protein [Pelagibacterium montanilacus]